MRSKLFLCFCLALLATPVIAQDSAWIGSWGASPLPTGAGAGTAPTTRSFDHQTIRQVVRLSAGGDRVRLRLTNEYGATPLRIGAASIALVDDHGDVRSETIRKLTFGGDAGATIPAGSPLVSDPVELRVDALASLSISLYLPESTGACTCHQVAMQSAYISAAGDFTDAAFEPAEVVQVRAFLSGVEVDAREPAKVIVLLGDSITDGVGSTPNANHRWPDRLAERLAARNDGVAWGVVNEGISGNRILSDGAGQSALARFDRDVLSVAGATHVVVFEGVNDLGIRFGSFSGPRAEAFRSLPKGDVTVDTMIAGYRQLIRRAHSKGLVILGATIAPYEGASYYAEAGESVREAINEWIRTGGEFDGVLDFDLVLRDPAEPKRIATPLHAGDHLHGSDAGYRTLADSIDLGLFD